MIELSDAEVLVIKKALEDYVNCDFRVISYFKHKELMTTGTVALDILKEKL